MKNDSNSDDPLLTPESAALLANMSRPAFLKHIGVDIEVDEFVGNAKRARFRTSTVVAFVAARKQNGAKKRGPKPKKRKGPRS